MVELHPEMRKIVEETIESAFVYKKESGDEMSCIQLFVGSNGFHTVTHIFDENELARIAILFGGLCDGVLIYIIDSWYLSPSAVRKNPILALQLAADQLDLSEISSNPDHELHKFVTESLLITVSAKGHEDFSVRVPYTTYEGKVVTGDWSFEESAYGLLESIQKGKESFPIKHEDLSPKDMIMAQISSHVMAAKASYIGVEVVGEDHCEQTWKVIMSIINTLKEKDVRNGKEPTFVGGIKVANDDGVYAAYTGDKIQTPAGGDE